MTSNGIKKWIVVLGKEPFSEFLSFDLNMKPCYSKRCILFPSAGAPSLVMVCDFRALLLEVPLYFQGSSSLYSVVLIPVIGHFPKMFILLESTDMIGLEFITFLNHIQSHDVTWKYHW